MRTIPEGLAQSLAGPVTTLARLWRVTRTDGHVLGFTDHDEAIVLDDTRFAAATGMMAGQAEASLGLSAGTQEMEGALSADAIDEDDIFAGLYDGARVESFVVDWTRPERHMRLSVSTIGEIRRSSNAFTAELRGPEAALDRQRGRSYRRRCDAALGDERCRVDLEREGLTRTGIVIGGDGALLDVSNLGPLDVSLFERGRLTMTAGRMSGASREVAGLEERGEGWRIALAEPLGLAPVPGDAFRLSAGCDKSFSTCRERFANTLNFRGFPHMPGLDAVLGIAKRDDVHDGSALVP